MDDTKREPGTVYTFYSYKGGVGRTMALANCAALLAKWGHSVLIVDWDLEAPGVERFFSGISPNVAEQRRSKPGIADLISMESTGQEINWLECLIEVYPSTEQGPLSIISAGRNDEGYVERVQSLDFQHLFREKQLGSYIERLRNEWISRFEFVLVDSRTGITDIGGICTIHLPDILVLLFTATHPSVDGVIEVLRRSRSQQSHLPFDRRRLLAVPVPARDESRTELKKANQWKGTFGERFADAYKDWLPSDKSPRDALDILRIPYIPYWSFGEPLPVVEEGTSDPTSLGFAYQSLARFLATKLDWKKALSGEFVARPVSRSEAQWNLTWIESQRRKARQGLEKAGWSGSVEIRFFSPNSTIVQPQDQLLRAARVSAIHTFGWPIGLVLDSADSRPRPNAEGIAAEITSGHSYDYWALTKQVEFYTLMSLFEDFKEGGIIFVDTQIVRTTEALLYCSALFTQLGADPNTLVRLGVTYAGLKGRRLTAASPYRGWPMHGVNTDEDSIDTEVAFTLDSLDNQLVDLVEKLCSPLFLLFNFARIQRGVYEEIVTNFRQGKVV